MKTLNVVIVVAVLSLGFSQIGGQSIFGQEVDQHITDLIGKIQQGDVTAISEAGLSRNRFFVPYLHELLNKHTTRKDVADVIGPTRIALARMGETREQQEVWCEAISGLPLPENLGNVGGWYGIRGLQAFLSPEVLPQIESETGKDYREHPYYDAVPLSPEAEALVTLQTLVPHLPSGIETEGFAIQAHLSKEIKIWQEFIAKNANEFRKLEPIGEGVEFSVRACKNGKPIK
jgi:hypothetical protein